MFYKIGFFVLVAVAVFMGGVYSSNFLRKPSLPSPIPKLIEEGVATSPTPTSSPTINPNTDQEEIRAAMAKKYAKTTEEVNIQINQNTGTHVWGSVKFQGEGAGAWFLAYKKTEGWIIVDDGNGTISCEKIAPYDFPAIMAPECVDKNGKLIKRNLE